MWKHQTLHWVGPGIEAIPLESLSNILSALATVRASANSRSAISFIEQLCSSRWQALEIPKDQAILGGVLSTTCNLELAQLSLPDPVELPTDTSHPVFEGLQGDTVASAENMN